MVADEHEHLSTGWEPDVDPGDTLLRAHHLAFAEYFAQVADVTPGGRVERSADHVFADTGSPFVLGNAVAPLRPHSEAELDALLEAARTFFAAAPGGPYTFLSPWPTPDLRTKGFGAIGHPPFMVRPAGGDPPPVPPSLRIEKVDDKRGLAVFERTMIEAYPVDELAHAPPGAMLPPAMLDLDTWHMWVGYEGDRPVGTAAATVVHGANHVEWISARPDTRGRGYGAALTWAATLADPKLPAALIASDLGAPVYARMGYLTVSRFSLWAGSRGQ